MTALTVASLRGQAPTKPAASAPSATDLYALREFIARGADYLVRTCRPSGQFIYRINLDPDVRPDRKYNVLRHAGTMYSLVMAYEHRPDPRIREALLRSGRFLRQHCIAPVPGEEHLLAVWSRPELNGSDAPEQAKLGGTGLALVALLSLERIEAGFTPIEELRRLGRFLLSMQKPDGGFYSKYFPSRRGRDDSWTSLYYPGEAALGLVMLYERDPNPDWRRAAARAIGFLARQRHGRRYVEADHWALLATARLMPVFEPEDLSLPQAAVLHHAVQICESILVQQQHAPTLPRVRGGFTPDGRTTPTATRLEGLLAAITFLPDSHAALKQRIREAARQGIEFLLRAQIRSGLHEGAIARAIQRLPTGHPQYSASFNRRATEVRIDYVQHAVSAMIQYIDLIEPKAP